MDEEKLEKMTIAELGLKEKTYKALQLAQPRAHCRIKLAKNGDGDVLVKSLLRYRGEDFVSRYKRGLWYFGPAALKDLEERLAVYGLKLEE